MPKDSNFEWNDNGEGDGDGGDAGSERSIGCLAEYGGPAFPYVVLGGYRENGENETVSDESLYMNATALVLTFLINNKKDKDLLGPALDWEKA